MEYFLWVLPGFLTYLLIIRKTSSAPILNHSEYILIPVLSSYSLVSILVSLLVTKISNSCPFFDGNLNSILINSSKMGKFSIIGIIFGLASIYLLSFFKYPLEVLSRKDSLCNFIAEIYSSNKKFLCMVRTKQGRVYIGHISKREENRRKDDFLFIVPVLAGNYDEGKLKISTTYMQPSPLGFLKFDDDFPIENGISTSEISSITNFNFRRFLTFYVEGSIAIDNYALKSKIEEILNS